MCLQYSSYVLGYTIESDTGIEVKCNLCKHKMKWYSSTPPIGQTWSFTTVVSLPVPLLHSCVRVLLVQRCSLPLSCNNDPNYAYFLACRGQEDLPFYVLVHECTYFTIISNMFSLM